MPLIHISLLKGKTPDYIKKLADGVHEALRRTWGIPEHDRFQLIHEYEKSHFFIDPIMWDVSRSDNVVVIYITSIPRDQSKKEAFYQEVVAILNDSIALRPEDVFVSIVHNDKEDWSFGGGIPQLLRKN